MQHISETWPDLLCFWSVRLKQASESKLPFLVFFPGIFFLEILFLAAGFGLAGAALVAGGTAAVAAAAGGAATAALLPPILLVITAALTVTARLLYKPQHSTTPRSAQIPYLNGKNQQTMWTIPKSTCLCLCCMPISASQMIQCLATSVHHLFLNAASQARILHLQYIMCCQREEI